LKIFVALWSYFCFKKRSLDSAIISFKEASASSVNCFVEPTISRYGFCDVDRYETKLAQYNLTSATSNSSK